MYVKWDLKYKLLIINLPIQEPNAYLKNNIQ